MVNLLQSNDVEVIHPFSRLDSTFLSPIQELNDHDLNNMDTSMNNQFFFSSLNRSRFGFPLKLPPLPSVATPLKLNQDPSLFVRVEKDLNHINFFGLETSNLILSPTSSLTSSPTSSPTSTKKSPRYPTVNEKARCDTVVKWCVSSIL